jgi:hypothetical protein
VVTTLTIATSDDSGACAVTVPIANGSIGSVTVTDCRSPAVLEDSSGKRRDVEWAARP